MATLVSDILRKAVESAKNQQAAQQAAQDTATAIRVAAGKPAAPPKQQGA